MEDRHRRHRRPPVDRRRSPSSGYRATSSDRFAQLVDDAVATLPPDLLAYVDNVQIVIDDVPPDDALAEGVVLLGLYEGVPQTERTFDPYPLPDRVTLYRRPIEMRAQTRQQLAMVVLETVVHEIAHHFGIDDDRLDELGWG